MHSLIKHKVRGELKIENMQGKWMQLHMLCMQITREEYKIDNLDGKYFV